MRYLIANLECPVCGAEIALAAQTAQVQCPGCQNQFSLRGRLCPNCGRYHNKNVSVCEQCDRPLELRCPECGAYNWSGDEVCQQCGASIDLVTRLLKQTDTTERLQQQMVDSRRIKEQGAASSNARMERMLAEERADIEALRRRQLEQQAAERKLLRTMGLLIGVMLVIFIVYMLLTL
ncbi:MAG TPA: zinc ribbon domain-containing protein [Thermoflexia bacterium]|nr:zinc ribbon domain-containing protein [Thermoflexia bacterium]